MILLKMAQMQPLLMIIHGLVSSVCFSSPLPFNFFLFSFLYLFCKNELLYDGSANIAIDFDAQKIPAAEQTSTSEKAPPAKTIIEGNTQPPSGIEDLFKDSPSIMPTASDKPQKDVKNDIMSLFEKVMLLSLIIRKVWWPHKWASFCSFEFVLENYHYNV